MKNVPYIHTKDGITIYFDGENLAVPSSDPDFKKLLQILRDPLATDWNFRNALAPVRDRIKEVVQAHAKDGFSLQNGVVQYKGEYLNSFISAKLEKMIEQNWDLKPIAAFLDNLSKNPSNRVVNDLYAFLEYGKMPITPDGCFLAYKSVGPNYLDIHSRTFDNSVGKTVSMPRNKVDEDPDRTCSAGLHVCSFEYLASFGGAHVMVCKINPKDVVAIPRDYNNTKMRVSEYTVIAEVTERPQDKRNVLASRPAFEESTNFADFDDEIDDLDDLDDLFDDDLEGETFVVDGVALDGNETDLGEAGSSDEAKALAYRLFQQYQSITVRSSVDGRVVLKLSAIS